jgi:hypothetical protein
MMQFVLCDEEDKPFISAEYIDSIIGETSMIMR